jgi:hypothetical protein
MSDALLKRQIYFCRALTLDQLENALLEAESTLDDRNFRKSVICKSIINEKLGKRKYDVPDVEGLSKYYFAYNVDETKIVDPSKGFLTNLLEGNYGLAKTYWLYDFLFGWLLTIFAYGIVILTKSPDLFPYIFIFLIPYQVCVTIGVWNAASKYDGSKMWAVLARISVVLSALFTLLQLMQMR